MIKQFHLWVYHVYPKELKSWSQRDICTPIVIAALFSVAKKVEATQVSIDRWMEKQNVAHAFHGIVFSLKKKGSSNIWYNIDKP